jgi:hypothetical protein
MEMYTEMYTPQNVKAADLTHFGNNLVRPVAELVRRTVLHRYVRFDVFRDGPEGVARKQAAGRVVVARAIRRVVCSMYR